MGPGSWPSRASIAGRRIRPSRAGRGRTARKCPDRGLVSAVADSGVPGWDQVDLAGTHSDAVPITQNWGGWVVLVSHRRFPAPCVPVDEPFAQGPRELGELGSTVCDAATQPRSILLGQRRMSALGLKGALQGLERSPGDELGRGSASGVQCFDQGTEMGGVERFGVGWTWLGVIGPEADGSRVVCFNQRAAGKRSGGGESFVDEPASDRFGSIWRLCSLESDQGPLASHRRPRGNRDGPFDGAGHGPRPVPVLWWSRCRRAGSLVCTPQSRARALNAPSVARSGSVANWLLGRRCGWQR